MEKKTALYECHKKLGGKMVSFAGYWLPVQYASGVIGEHMAVRTKAGLFDVSHMGEVICSGSDALDYLNHLLTNDFTNMDIGQVRYTLMCNEQGGVVDDLLVYRLEEERYMLVINASNREKDVEWMREHSMGNVQIEDISEQVSLVALQGPMAKEILAKLTDTEQLPAKYYRFAPHCNIDGVECLVSQTGYTGEFGYELYVSNDQVVDLWTKLLEVGEEFGLAPCGLGARDTLRLEAAMPLYGHEMDETINPLEAGLAFAVKMKKDEFIGKEGLEKQDELSRTRVGLAVVGRGIVREGAAVIVDGKEIGVTTSGTHCPALNGAYAMALVNIDYSKIGTIVEAEVRGRKIAAKVVELPFYQRQ